MLLILAGVAISLTIGNNGIISRAINARDKTIVADEEEAITLAYAARKMDDYTKNVIASDLQEELSNANRDTRVTSSGDDLIVLYNDTNHRYRVNQNGEIEQLEDMTPELAKSVVRVTTLGNYLCVELMDGTVGLIPLNYTSPNMEQIDMNDMQIISNSGIKSDYGGNIVDNDGKVYISITIEGISYIICLNDTEGSILNNVNIKKSSGYYMIGEDGKIYRQISYEGDEIIELDNAGTILEGKNIVDIYEGYRGVFLIDRDGKIYDYYYDSYYDTLEISCVNENYENGLNGNNIKEIMYDNATGLILDNNGKVYAWGSNDYGLLGDENLEDSSIPICISDLENDMNGKNIVKIYFYEDTAFAIDSDGNAYNWGINYYNRESYEITNPIKIFEGKKIKDILVKRGSIIALDSDGKVYTWGYGNYGMLGNGSTENINFPVCISENVNNKLYGKTIEKIYSITPNGIIAKDIEGNIYGWGKNSNAELGNGTYEEVLMPECFNEITTNKLYNKKVEKVLSYGTCIFYFLDNGDIIYSNFHYAT